MNKRILTIICFLFLLLFIINNNKQELFINYNKIEYSDKLSINNIKHLKKGQKIMTNMFKEYDRICRKHNLKYWCDGGTLLGIIRNNKWITYDGDIDTAMMEEDYIKLKKIIQKELPQGMWFQANDLLVDKHYKAKGLAKIRDLNSCYVEYTNGKNGKNNHNGLQLDIFIVKKKGNHFFNRENHTYNYNDIFPLKEDIFEGFKVYIPNNTNLILTKYYGKNYMKMLPKDKRYPHEGIIDSNKTCDFHYKKYPALYKK